jgi:hypothetical protein
MFVIDATGKARSMTDFFGMVAHGGTLVYVGLVIADISFHDSDFHRREITFNSNVNSPPQASFSPDQIFIDATCPHSTTNEWGIRMQQSTNFVVTDST